MITLVSGPKQYLPKHMQHSVSLKLMTYWNCLIKKNSKIVSSLHEFHELSCLKFIALIFWNPQMNLKRLEKSGKVNGLSQVPTRMKSFSALFSYLFCITLYCNSWLKCPKMHEKKHVFAIKFCNGVFTTKNAIFTLVPRIRFILPVFITQKALFLLFSKLSFVLPDYKFMVFHVLLKAVKN